MKQDEEEAAAVEALYAPALLTDGTVIRRGDHHCDVVWFLVLWEGKLFVSETVK